MDFAGQAMIDMLMDFPFLSQHKYSTEWGEPWIFGLPDEHESEFFRECGVELREIIPFFGREASRRYLTRSDGTSLGSVRGGPPRRRVFTTTVRIIWRFLRLRSKWYAVAALTVPSERVMQ